jgi:sugar transferase (PEP-CTERM/EpsH1 system associated)
MDILFLSHCVPNPPDKGEKIRSYHELAQLAERYRVHLACFARNRSEVAQAHELRDRCASIYVEPLAAGPGLMRAGLNYAAGRSLTASFYGSSALKQHIRSLSARPVSATVAYSSVMAQYAPQGIPIVLDMVDVDSEKWMQYGQVRRIGMLYRSEGRRLRRIEIDVASRAARTFLSTWKEARLLRSIAPRASVRSMENGVDFDYFDPSIGWESPDLRKRFIAFVGAMDYYPNAEAACWFASQVFPQIRRQQKDMEFLIVGRNPTAAVRRLDRLPGITVTGAVADVRPYLSAAEAAIAPLRIARGIQNKVLEALAMGKRTLASTAVCDTFSEELPPGVLRCRSAQDYVEFFQRKSEASDPSPAAIRSAARRRFSWKANFEILTDELQLILGRPAAQKLPQGSDCTGGFLGLYGDAAKITTGGFSRAE